MQNFKASGVVDYLPKTKNIKNSIETILLKIFEDNGYSEIEPPILTPYNLYKKGIGEVEDNLLFKIQDTDGSLLVLRNDITLPISRIVANSYEIDENPIRIGYRGSSFSLTSEINRLREFAQVGIELYNVDNHLGDAEVIALAINSLLACGIENFQIDIGQVGIIKGILKNTALSDGETKEIISLIDKKNIISENSYPFLDTITIKRLNNITALYGGKEVLDKAKEILETKESLDALAELSMVYSLLESIGLERYISFDLGLVNSFSYYSGIVFKGITSNFGAPILGGGRYDKLMTNFNKNISATGFAIGINDLLKSLEKQGNNIDNGQNRIAIVLDDEVISYQKSNKIKEQLIHENFKVEVFYNKFTPKINYCKIIKIVKGEVI